jgi:glycosyltransferase involved in cell wall biosynthesis
MSSSDGAARVLQVVQPEDGGVAEHVLQLSLGLRRRGFDVEVAASPGNVACSALARAGIPVHALAFSRHPSPADLRVAVSLRRLDAQRQYRLVHAHSSKAGALVRGALPFPGRLIYTPHCPAFCSAMRRPTDRLLYRAVEQALVPRTAAFVAVSRWEASRLARGLLRAERRVHIIPHGVPACEHREADAGIRAFKGHASLVGLISALRPGKDVFTLLRAMESIAGQGGPPIRLAIVGNGPLEGAVRAEIARLGLGRRIRHFEFQGPVERWLESLDVFVLPTDWESLPLSVLEAMRCGVPVVATDVGGVGEAVEDGRTGRLVPPRDHAALAAAILDVLGDPRRREAMGRAAREVAQRRFEVERMIDGVASLYGRLLRDEPPTGAPADTAQRHHGLDAKVAPRADRFRAGGRDVSADPRQLDLRLAC